MDHEDFDGTTILETFAELDMLDTFFEAVDNDDLEKVGWLMRAARFDEDAIAMVLQMIVDGDLEH